MAKNKEKPKEQKEKRRIKTPARVLEKVQSTSEGVALVSKPGLAKASSRPRPKSNEGEVRVISFDRIVLSKKWTGPLGVTQGDSLKVRLEEGNLILTK